ncbi:adhesion G-protein coupled receptor G6-like [Clavelina lepadiformis]|uniref:adhesion G-protein coupled receptor G6-like n=1 Tax=Clavelina lepadiformis TaxID=159417 RepID=UPI0040433B0C
MDLIGPQKCNHLTNFASLFAFGNITDNRGLDILTYVGCSISGIASLLTIIALLITWKSVKVQMRQSTKFVMLNLSFSLFLLNILILISEIPGVRSDEGKCKAVAGTLHFALISAFLWMFAQAVPVFISIINPIHFKTTFSSKKFVISFLCLGWGLPVVLVGLVATLKPQWYAGQVNDVTTKKITTIEGKFRCWIVPDMMLYLVIIPAAIVLSCNLLLYLWSVISFFSKKRPGEKVTRNKNKQQYKEAKRRLKFSVILFVMFGITWIFGFLIFNSSDVSLAFAYIFTIFNSLQGFSLFIVAIGRKKAIRESIQETFVKLTPTTIIGCSK